MVFNKRYFNKSKKVVRVTSDDGALGKFPWIRTKWSDVWITFYDPFAHKDYTYCVTLLSKSCLISDMESYGNYSDFKDFPKEKEKFDTWMECAKTTLEAFDENPDFLWFDNYKCYHPSNKSKKKYSEDNRLPDIYCGKEYINKKEAERMLNAFVGQVLGRGMYNKICEFQWKKNKDVKCRRDDKEDEF